MKHLLLILFTIANVLGEQAALKEQALPAINAKILIPLLIIGLITAWINQGALDN